MNPIHRLGLTVASVVAVATVASAFALQSFVAAGQTASQTTVQNAPQTTFQNAPQATASSGPEIVYLSPVQPKPTAPPAQQRTTRVVVRGHDDSSGSDR